MKISFQSVFFSLIFITLFCVFSISGLAQNSSCCNILTNGNFEQGDTGFTSGLPMNCACSANSYCVGTNFQVKCTGWDNFVGHLGSGQFLIIDGSTNSAVDVWRNTVVVSTEGEYCFSFWVASQYASVFDLGFTINGTSQGGPFTVSQPDPIWTEYSGTVFLAQGTHTIAIRQLSPGAQRDFGIDDISFGTSLNAGFIVDLSINCGANLNFINTSIGPLPLAYSWNFGDPTSGSNNFSTLQHPSHLYSSCGEFEVCLIVTDGICIDTSCQIIVAEDFISPNIICPSFIILNCDDDLSPGTTGYATAADNCDTNPNLTYIDATFGNILCGGEIIRTWVATDFCGNTSTCNQIIIVNDNIPPVITCPTNVIVNALPPECTVQVNNIKWLTNTDNCGTPTVNYTIAGAGAFPSFGINDASGADFNSGISTVSYISTDQCGNKDTCMFTVTVICDTMPTNCVCSPSENPKPNLVTNGNFELGDNFFNTDLNTPGGSCLTGTYSVGNDFPVQCNLWPAGVFDHTFMTNTGNFMIIDGNPTNAPTVWSQSVNVVPGKTYEFCFWTASVYCANQQDFSLNVVIHGIDTNTGSPASDTIGQEIIVGPCTPGQPFTPTWTQHHFTWTCPPNLSLFNLEINQVAGAFGNLFTDFGLDDICFTEADSCCSDYDTFCENLMNAVNVTIDNSLCKATLNINNLPECDSILNIDWGDIEGTDPGPYGNGDMPMHVFASSGAYIISYLAIEVDPQTGLICFEKVFSDTIVVECSCECTTGEMTLTQGNDVYQVLCNLHGIPNNLLPVLDCPASPLSISGNFGCYKSAGLACPSTINWKLTDHLLNTTNGSGTLPIVLPQNLLGTPGTYTLTMTTLCPGAQDSCFCSIRWIQPPCDTCFCAMGTDLGYNLVTNGNFGLGDNYFSNSLFGDNFGLCFDDAYLIANNFSAKCSLWPNLPIGRPDGSLASNNFLIIDGGTANPMTVWSQQVNVVPNMTYLFSFWTASVYPPGQQSFWLDVVFDNPAETENVLISQPVGNWVYHSFTWTCPSNFGTSITLSINQNFGGTFRDFGIDDICFTKITPEDTCCDDDKNIVNNGSFTGLVPGPLPNNSAPWYAANLSPDYSTSDGCKAPGMIQMWGNSAFGEVLGQLNPPVMFKAGWTYKVSFCAKFTNINNLPSNLAHGWFNLEAGSGGTPIGQSPVLKQDNVWVPVVLPNWTPSVDYDRLLINFENSSSAVDSDSISWGRIDDICIEVVDSTSCCRDYNAFCKAFENAITLTINRDSCKATFNIGDLPCDDYIEWINWGHGPLDGPYSEGSMPMHTYPNSGTFYISYLAIERDPSTGLICYEKVFKDTIKIDCSCHCGMFDKIKLVNKKTGLSQNLSCNNPSLIGLTCPPQGKPYKITGKLNCVPTNCTGTQLHWELQNHSTGVPVASGNQTGPWFSITLDNNVLQGLNGLYDIVLTGLCGTDTCRCVLHFDIAGCPNPMACPCDSDFSANVFAGYSNTYDFSNGLCQVNLKPVALSECDVVTWTIQGLNISFNATGSSLGNQTFTITLPTNTLASYQIWMTVERPNTTCRLTFTNIHSFNCLIVGAGNGTCEDNAILNSGFDKNSMPGILGLTGSTEGWVRRAGEPELINDEGCEEPFAIKIMGLCWPVPIDVIDHPIVVKPKSGFKVSACYKAREDDLMPGTQLVFRLSDEPQDNINCIGKCIEVARLPILKTGDEWSSLSAVFFLDGVSGNKFLTLHLENDLAYNDTTAASTILIDNICFEQNDSTVIVNTDDISDNGKPLRIFPNPNSGSFTLELPQPAKPDMSIRIIGITGQILWDQRIEVGAKLQMIQASALPSGMYFLQVWREGRIVAVEKFVKM